MSSDFVGIRLSSCNERIKTDPKLPINVVFGRLMSKIDCHVHPISMLINLFFILIDLFLICLFILLVKWQIFITGVAWLIFCAVSSLNRGCKLKLLNQPEVEFWIKSYSNCILIKKLIRFCRWILHQIDKIVYRFNQTIQNRLKIGQI